MRLGVNPVLRREALERWRGRRAMWVLTVYLGVLGGVVYGLYRVGTAILDSQFGVFARGIPGVQRGVAGPLLGRFLVEGLLFFLLLLVLFITPGYAAAQLAGEKERRTLPLLQVTLLRPSQIVLGKVGASGAWTALLVLAAMPMGAAAAVLGGVDLGDFLAGVAAVLVIGVSVAAMAVGISSLVRRTTAAVVLSYALVLALTLGTGVLGIIELVAGSRVGVARQPPISLRLNPFLALADAVDARGSSGFFGLPSPLTPFGAVLPDDFAPLRLDGPAPVIVGQAFAVQAAVPEVPLPAPTPLRLPEPEGAAAPPTVAPAMPVGEPAVSAMTEGPGVISAAEPLTAVTESFAGAPPGQVFAEPVLDGFGPAFPLQPGLPAGDGRSSVWWTSLLAYVALGALGAVVASHRLRTVRPPRRATTWGGFVAAPTPPALPAEPPPAPDELASSPSMRGSSAISGRCRIEVQNPAGPPPQEAAPATAPAAEPAAAREPVRAPEPAAVREPGADDARPDDVWDPEGAP